MNGDQTGISGNGVVSLVNRGGASRFLLVCEHASNFIPLEYAALGLSRQALQSHVAWDPGAAEVAALLSADLDAPLVAGRVSRLVYDCNRPPTAPDAIPAKSETTEVPGNADLTDEERSGRVAAVYEPFQDMLATTILRAPRPPVLVTIHSFTPRFNGAPRHTELGIVHDADSRLADAMLVRAAEQSTLRIARNDPYGPEHGVTHTLRAHALPQGLLNVMLEIRNDLISSPGEQQRMAAMLAGLLRQALDDLENRSESKGTRCRES